MSKTKARDRSSHPARESNPFCPVCGEGEERDLSKGARSEPREVEAHSCLLSIINAHYLLSKKEMGKGK